VKAAATLVERTLSQGGGVVLATSQGIARVQTGRADTDVQRFRLFDLLARLRACDQPLADVLRTLSIDTDSQCAVLTARHDPALSALLAEFVRTGRQVRVLFFEPASFGAAASQSPAIRGADLVVFRRSDSPWEDGGRRFGALLRGVES